jgi:hypothetical protein
MIDSDVREEYPEGYTEALDRCRVLAVQLLKMALQDSQEAAS